MDLFTDRKWPFIDEGDQILSELKLNQGSMNHFLQPIKY